MSPETNAPEPLVLEERTYFVDWQTQLKLACEADRRDDIAAIVALRMPTHLVLRNRTVFQDPPKVQQFTRGKTTFLATGQRRTVEDDQLVSTDTVLAQRGSLPLRLPEPGNEDAPGFLYRLLRDPWSFSGSCLFWARSLEALRLLEEAGASTEDVGWQAVPLLVHVAKEGHADIVRFLIEERGHDPNVAHPKGNYTALHWARGLDLVRYLIAQGANPNALTGYDDPNMVSHFGDSVLAQQLRTGQADVVDYLLGLGEEHASHANLLQWLGEEPNPEMLRVLLRHGISLNQPIPTMFGESYPPGVTQRILSAGIQMWRYAKETPDGEEKAKAIVECVDILLAHGDYASAYDASGRLPYHVLRDCLPETDEPLRQELEARLAQFNGPRKRPSRKRS